MIFRAKSIFSQCQIAFLKLVALNRSRKCDGISSHYKNFQMSWMLFASIVSEREKSSLLEFSLKRARKNCENSPQILSVAFRHVCAMCWSIKEAVSCCHVELFSRDSFSLLFVRIVEFSNVGRPLYKIFLNFSLAYALECSLHPDTASP